MFNAPDAAAGKKTACPKCGGTIEIPDPAAQTPRAPAPAPVPPAPASDDVFEAEEVPSGLFDDEEFGLEAPPELPTPDNKKPCPMCGEMIQADAVKCRFCGEVFDPVLKKKQRRASSPGDEDMSVFEWVLAILCSTIGCIVGIVYMVQGKPKGKKMFLVSLGVMVFWNVLSALIGLLGEVNN